jgi:hypothetical protein
MSSNSRLEAIEQSWRDLSAIARHHLHVGPEGFHGQDLLARECI